MPVFAKVQSEYGPLGVQVVAASVDVPQARPAVEAFVKQQKLAFPVWVGATPADMERAGVPSDAIPVTVLIDRDGTVKEAFIGRITEDRLTAALGSMVGNPGK
jgi:peroxiredoxin